jgi:probable F420-dependent oxidoreductase
MKVGVQLPLHVETSDGPAIRHFVAEVERLGYDSVWLGDHIVLPETIKDVSSYPYLWRFDPTISDLFPRKSFIEAATTAAYIAGASERLEIGVGVFVVPMREPVLLAKQLATIDVLSQGRLIAGLGAGWLREEFDSLGANYAERGARLDEYVEIMRTLWRGDQPVSFDGKFRSFEPLYCEPTPVRTGGIPLWVGGHTPAALKRCARFADGWHAIELSPAEFGQHAAALDGHIAARGRQSGDVVKSVATRLSLSPDADLGAAARTVADYAANGCDHLVVYATPSRSIDENLERFARLRTALG